MMRAASALVASVLLAAVAAGAWTSIANAHYRTDERWMFGGAITRAPSDPTKLDPVNMLFYPEGIDRSTNEAATARLHRHMRQHWRPNYADESGLKDIIVGDGVRERYCKNVKFLSFPAREERLQSNDTFVGWSNQRGIGEERCKTRFHARLWSDTNHPGLSRDTEPGFQYGYRYGHKDSYRSWVVAAIHHERVNIVRIGGSDPCAPAGTCPRPRLRKARGHYIDQDWDAVERSVIRQSRRSGSTITHPDPRGRVGIGHCVDYRWKPVPGSRGYFGAASTDGRPGARSRGFHSDGYVSRISMNHCARP